LQELSRFLTWPANGHDRRHHGSRYLRQPHPPRPNPEPPGSTVCGTPAETPAAVAAAPTEVVKTGS
jgi:putative (di)nucleoside polyphosphate hydrolase